MLIRLKNHGILDVASLCQADRATLHRIWGSIEGDRFWYALRGIALPEQSTSKRSFGHSSRFTAKAQNLLWSFFHPTECSKKPATAYA